MKWDMQMIKISSSILSADFTRLGDEIASLHGSDYLHFDVMDGVFVPNISVGLPVLESVRKSTKMPIDVHLMITSPTRYTARFAEAGADVVIFHVEAEQRENIPHAIDRLHSLRKRAGLSIRPGTPVSEVLPYLSELDVVLIMTVEPGFGGQGFIHSTLQKITELRHIIDSRNLPCDIEVDGGINPGTAQLCVRSGANILVAGNDIFSSPDREARIEALRRSG